MTGENEIQSKDFLSGPPQPCVCSWRLFQPVTRLLNQDLRFLTVKKFINIWRVTVFFLERLFIFVAEQLARTVTVAAVRYSRLQQRSQKAFRTFRVCI